MCGKNEECHDKENGYDCPCKSGYVREEDLCVRKYFHFSNRRPNVHNINYSHHGLNFHLSNKGEIYQHS